MTQRDDTTKDAASIDQIKSIDELWPLFENYIVHMKQFENIEDVPAWKQAAFEYLELYNTEPDRAIFVLRDANNNAVGFALVNEHLRVLESGKAIAEFYIDSEYQQLGYGKRLAQHAFSTFPGEWELRVHSRNDAAYQFWTKAISAVAQNNLVTKKEDSVNGTIFLFKY